MSGVRLISNLVELCMHTQWFPPPFTHSLTLALILYLLHVSSAWIWIILSCSPRGAFLSHVHMDLSPLQQQKKNRKRSSENILLSACDCWLFDHYYCWCFTVSMVACFLWFSLFILGGCGGVTHTHARAELHKKKTQFKKKKRARIQAFISLYWHLHL